MNTNSYLNPQSMRQQCSDAIADLSRDNNIYREISKRIDEFVGDSRFKSTGVDALKAHLSDYQFVIRAMIAANEYDIYDFNVLMNSVGYETLAGSDILYGKETSRQLKQENEQRAYEYEQKAADALLPIQKIYYKQKANNYRYMADLANQMFNRYVEKENEYHRIDNETRNLFGTSDALRQSAKNGLASLSTVFLDGTYVVSQTAPWKQEIMQSYADIFYSTDASGKLIPNWDGIEKCLKKDAGDITKEEYDSLALVYMNLEANELGRFLNLCMDKTKEHETSIAAYYIGSNFIHEDYTEWKVNDEKINSILERTIDTATVALYVMRNGEDVEAENAENVRDILLQKIVLLRVLTEIGKTRSDYQSNTAGISIEVIQDGTWKLKFFEEYYNCERHEHRDLRESVVLISSTEKGANIHDKIIDEGKEDCKEQIYVSSILEDTTEFATEEMMDFILEEEIYDNMGKISSYAIPIIGNIINSGIDIWQERQERAKNLQYVETYFDDVEATNTYADYDYSINLVEYDTYNITDRKIYASEGEMTDIKIERVNELLDYPITKEIIVNNPDKVWEETEEKKAENPKWKRMYERIISNKEVYIDDDLGE